MYLSMRTDETQTQSEILEDKFSNAQLFSVQIVNEYFADIIQYISTGTAP